MLKNRLHTPEATSGKYGGFLATVRGGRLVDQGTRNTHGSTFRGMGHAPGHHNK
jgi:hypothetical protein